MTTEPKKTGAKNIFIHHLRLIIRAIFAFIRDSPLDVNVGKTFRGELVEP